MSRLTEYHCGVAVIKDKNKLKDAMQKLANYEDLEEQSLLLKLPCKVGTMVYEVYEFGIVWEDWQIDQHPISLEDVPKFGKTVFLTEAEAEKALEEMEKSHGCTE